MKPQHLLSSQHWLAGEVHELSGPFMTWVVHHALAKRLRDHGGKLWNATFRRRALVRKPDVLILDEATNAVDNETEGDIPRALQKVAG